MPEQPRLLANKYEDIVNLEGAGAYCGGFPHSLLLLCPSPYVWALKLSDDARLTSVCRVHRAEVKNREAYED